MRFAQIVHSDGIHAMPVDDGSKIVFHGGILSVSWISNHYYRRIFRKLQQRINNSVVRQFRCHPEWRETELRDIGTNLTGKDDENGQIF